MSASDASADAPAATAVGAGAGAAAAPTASNPQHRSVRRRVRATMADIWSKCTATSAAERPSVKDLLPELEKAHSTLPGGRLPGYL